MWSKHHCLALPGDKPLVQNGKLRYIVYWSEIRRGQKRIGTTRPLLRRFDSSGVFDVAAMHSPASSSEEDAADSALHFRVFSRREFCADNEAQPQQRPQLVVDKTPLHGSEVMPLQKVLSSAKRSSSPPHKLQHVRDGFILREVLHETECDALIAAAEAQGFTFWGAPEGVSQTPCSTKKRFEANKLFRAADTLEVRHPELAEVLWVRMVQQPQPL